MIMYDFCALSPKQRKTLLEKLHKLLSKNGKILLDVLSEDSFNQKQETFFCEHNQLNKFWSEKDYYAFVNTFVYKDEKVVLDKYTIFEESNNYTVYNWLQYFSIKSLKQELEANNFRIADIYQNVAGDKYIENSDDFAVVIEKKV